MAGRPKHFAHQRFPANGWSIYGAQRAQPVATGGEWDALKNRSNGPTRNRWQPTATVSQRMVRNAMKERLPRSHAPRVLERRREAPRNVVRRIGSQPQAS